MNQDTPSDKGKTGPAAGDGAGPDQPSPIPSDEKDGLGAAPPKLSGEADEPNRDDETAADPLSEDPRATSSDGSDDGAPAVLERTVEVRRGGALAGLALIIALAGAAGSAWLWSQLGGGTGDDPALAAMSDTQLILRGEVERLSARVATLENAATAAAATPAGPGPDPALRSDVAANRNATNALEARLEALDRRLANAASTPAPMPAAAPVQTGSGSAGWERAEIELLLRVAQRQMTLAHDAGAAEAAMAEADRNIETLDDPSLLPVRQQIASDLLAIRSLPQPDIDGIAFRLGSMQARVGSLTVREGAGRDSEENASAAEPEDAGMERLERKSKEFIDGLVRVRDSTSDDRVFHTPAEVWFLRRNLELELQAARVALLTGNPGAYRESLRKARNWTGTYFDTGDPGVQAFADALDDLEARTVNVDYPDVSGSLRVFLETIGTDERGE